MPTINLGVDYATVEHEDVIKPMPGGTYPFTVADVEEAISKASGRPMLKWSFRVPYENGERRMTSYSVLPWEKDGEMDMSGVGMLVSITKALGLPWTGQELVTEDYLGRGGTMEVKQKHPQVKDEELGSATYGKYVNDPDPDATPVNDIKKFVY